MKLHSRSWILKLKRRNTQHAEVAGAFVYLNGKTTYSRRRSPLPATTAAHIVESALLSMQHPCRKKLKPTIRQLRHALPLFPSQLQPWPVYGPPVTSNANFIKMASNRNIVNIEITVAETNSKYENQLPFYSMPMLF